MADISQSERWRLPLRDGRRPKGAVEADLPEYRLSLQQVPPKVHVKVGGTARRHYSETEVLDVALL